RAPLAGVSPRVLRCGSRPRPGTNGSSFAASRLALAATPSVPVALAGAGPSVEVAAASIDATSVRLRVAGHQHPRAEGQADGEHDRAHDPHLSHLASVQLRRAPSSSGDLVLLELVRARRQASRLRARPDCPSPRHPWNRNTVRLQWEG